MLFFFSSIIFDVSGSYSMMLWEYGAHIEEEKHLNFIQIPKLGKNMQFGAYFDINMTKKSNSNSL